MKQRRRSDILTKPTQMAELLLGQYVKPGDTVVDATCGNGHDTALLLRLVKTGCVYAFDIQQEALTQTEKLLLEQGCSCDETGTVRLICDSHSRMADYVEGPVQAVVFNLGYLPGGDKSVVTEPPETLAALQTALSLLAVGGVAVLTMYSGHDEGRERAAVLDFLQGLDRRKYHCVYMNLINQGDYPPEVAAVVKK